MKKCFNCMADYPEEPGLVCRCCGYDNETAQGEGGCLFPGSIIQGRYIVGNVQKIRDTVISYIGWDALFERTVQIQEYFPGAYAERSEAGEVACREECQSAYAEGLAQFYGRSRQLIRLYQEKDVVTYHACFPANETAYAVMEHRSEQTLEDWLQHKQIGEQDGLYLLQAALTAVEKVHRIGGYHGQIGADTFWMTSKGNMILKDFGGWTVTDGGSGTEALDEEEGPRLQPLDGVCRDAHGLAKLFLRIITGKEIGDEESLEGELQQGVLKISEPVLGVMRDALSYRLHSLEPMKGLDPDRRADCIRKAAAGGFDASSDFLGLSASGQGRTGRWTVKAGKKRFPWVIGIAACILMLAVAGCTAFGLWKKRKADAADSGYQAGQSLDEEEIAENTES